MNQEDLKSVLHYDPITGLFRWRFAKAYNTKPWSVAGGITTTTKGYMQIVVNRKAHMAHRLAWLYVHGEWPMQQIDHINGCKTDNKIDNLRDVSQSENMLNQSKPRNGKLLGVSWIKTRKKWSARLQINKKINLLGYFDDANSAHQAYLAAKKNFGVTP